LGFLVGTVEDRGVQLHLVCWQ